MQDHVKSKSMIVPWFENKVRTTIYIDMFTTKVTKGL